MEMRLRFPELLDQRGLTPYALAKRIAAKWPDDERVSLSAIYRLVRSRGHQRYFDSELMRIVWLELGLTKLDDLIDPESPERPKRVASARRKPKQSQSREAA